MKDDTISRAAALKGLEDLNIASFYEENEHSKEAYTETKAMLKALPPVDAVPVKHGRWIERESGTEDKENGFETVIVCSRCDFPATTFYSEDCESRTQIRTDFCPNCGAKMDGEENNGRSSGEVSPSVAGESV